MSKHTPGPWFIKRRKNWNFLAIYHIEKSKLHPDTVAGKPEIATGDIREGGVREVRRPPGASGEATMMKKTISLHLRLSPELNTKLLANLLQAQTKNPDLKLSSHVRQILRSFLQNNR